MYSPCKTLFSATHALSYSFFLSCCGMPGCMAAQSESPQHCPRQAAFLVAEKHDGKASFLLGKIESVSSSLTPSFSLEARKEPGKNASERKQEAVLSPVRKSKKGNQTPDLLALLPGPRLQASKDRCFATPRIAHVTDLLRQSLADEDKRVLLICDIDYTLIKSQASIGSDAWYRHALQQNVPKEELISILEMVWPMIFFQGVEKDTGAFVEEVIHAATELQDRFTFLCLTARQVNFHYLTKKHLEQANYKDMIRPNMLEIADDPLYLGDDPAQGPPDSIRYQDNICSCSGNHKGEVVDKLLQSHIRSLTKVKKNASPCPSRSKKQPFCNKSIDRQGHRLPELVIFVDDSSSNIDKVHQLFAQQWKRYSHTHTLCIHYTHQQEQSQAYTAASFARDNQQIEELKKLCPRLNGGDTEQKAEGLR